MTDNMDVRRLAYVSEKDVKQLRKYLKAYKQLLGEPTYSVEACRIDHPIDSELFDLLKDEDVRAKLRTTLIVTYIQPQKRVIDAMTPIIIAALLVA